MRRALAAFLAFAIAAPSAAESASVPGEEAPPIRLPNHGPTPKPAPKPPELKKIPEPVFELAAQSAVPDLDADQLIDAVEEFEADPLDLLKDAAPRNSASDDPFNGRRLGKMVSSEWNKNLPPVAGGAVSAKAIPATPPTAAPLQVAARHRQPTGPGFNPLNGGRRTEQKTGWTPDVPIVAFHNVAAVQYEEAGPATFTKPDKPIIGGPVGKVGTATVIGGEGLHEGPPDTKTKPNAPFGPGWKRTGEAYCEPTVMKGPPPTNGAPPPSWYMLWLLERAIAQARAQQQSAK